MERKGTAKCVLSATNFLIYFCGCMSNIFLYIRMVAVVALTLLAAGVAAQQPTLPRPGLGLDSLVPPPVAEPPDTVPLRYFLAGSPEVLRSDADTMPDFEFRMYDPARQSAIDWGTLGNVGSAARPLFFETTARRGFQTGIRAFDLYKMRPEDLRFYQHPRLPTEVRFNRGVQQVDDMSRVRISRTFPRKLTFALQMRRLGNLGQYRFQKVRQDGFSAGVAWPVNKRYTAAMVFTANRSEQQDNGGILASTRFDSISAPIEARVRLSEKANTLFLDRQLYFIQHLTFGSAAKRAFRATHTVRGRWEQFKFSNPGSSSEGTGLGPDSAFFSIFVTDPRGLRHFVGVNRLENTFNLATYKQKKAGVSSDELSVGLSHTLFRLRQEPLDSTFYNLFLTGQLVLAPSGRFALRARGQLGMLANIGEYQAEADLTLGLGKAGELRASLLSQRFPAGLLHQQLWVTERQVWQNTFAKPIETTLSATYALPLIGLEVTGRTHLINNFLYFDQTSRPQQTTAPLQVAQLLIVENLRFGPIRLDNTVALQQINRGDVLRLPGWFSKNSLYFAGKLFKKRLLANLGFDFRINAAFSPDAYQPLAWQFRLQDDLRTKPYPWVDGFATVKIATLRAFFRYENMVALVNSAEVLYQTAWHPNPFPAFRFGFAWRFSDSERATPGGNGGGGQGGQPSQRPPLGF
jgi:Putative porin